MSTVTPSGIRTRRGAPAWRQAVELLSSMRFAIALLTVICIASVIGTVLRQHEPVVSYVNQFGPFWAEVFLALRLNAVYSAWWFLLILAFLVASTSLCIARHTPKILADFKTFKEDIRVQGLRAFRHRAEAVRPAAPAAEAQRIGQALAASGWKVRLQERHTPEGTGWMVAAKAGAAHKLGYLAAHGAIVLVCLGGLLDGDLIVRAQTWWGGKSVYQGGGLVADVPAAHRLPASNPTFRGNLMVSEGTASDTAILSQSDGVLLQELPFTVELKKFIVEYYPTGMPRLFASDIVIHDKASGEKHETRVEVNHPARYKGISIYQSSFDDGGSRLSLDAVPLRAGIAPFTLEGVVGGSSQITLGEEALTVEYSGLRVINVENIGADGPAVDVRKLNLRQALEQRLGAADKTVTQRALRNVGPSISYKLRDAAGQAREYNNYMLPVDMGDGAPPAFLLGVRETPAEPFRYLRVPADEDGSLQGFIHLHATLHDPAQRARAVRRYVAQSVEANRADLQAQLTESATRVLGLFAGAEAVQGARPGGLQALADFLEQAVPEAEREHAAQVLLRILNGTLFALNQVAREANGRPPLPLDEASARLMQPMAVALSDLALYPAPVVLTLKDFTHVQASVFQVARAPGQTVVYLGCLLLVVGVFAMLYVRERRLWVWLSPLEGGARATMALSTNRKTLDADREFAQLTARLLPPA